MTPTATASIPYFTSAQILGAIGSIDPIATVRDAYTTLYDPENPPVKHVLPGAVADAFTLVMPYEHKPDNLFLEKVLFVDRKKRPGVAGYASVYDLSTHSPLAVLDATALTGYRTAAKSLLFASLYFQNRVHSTPKVIHIYGSSTQAFFHAALFSKYYAEAVISIITRSVDSRDKFEALLRNDMADRKIKVFNGPTNLGDDPDIIITTTSSQKPLIGQAQAEAVRLIIAVGSSSGKNSEIASEVVAKSNRYVDSRISIEGKGELKIPLDEGLIDRESIRELVDVLVDGASHVYGEMTTTLFVSKGLIIEDYAFVRKILGLK